MIRTLVYSLVFFISVAEVISYDFKKHCNTRGNPLAITSDGSISLSYSTDSRITTSCTVSVYNPDDLNQTTRVVAYFKSFDIDCKRSRMDIYDGKDTVSAKALTGLNGTCGSSNTIYYESTQKYMTFKFDDRNLSGSRFTIILTSFHTGKCQGNEFNCTNGFCIHDDLICNGYRNCENDADELACVVALAMITIVIIVVVVFVAAVTTCVLLFCLVCRPRRRRMQYRQI